MSSDLDPARHLWDEIEHTLCEPDLVAPLSLMLLWLNGSTSLQPSSKKLVEEIPRRFEGCEKSTLLATVTGYDTLDTPLSFVIGRFYLYTSFLSAGSLSSL